MTYMDFRQFERFEEQVHRARELFEASRDHPHKPELMRVLASAERALDEARRRVGLDPDRTEPLPWWTEWQARHRRR